MQKPKRHGKNERHTPRPPAPKPKGKTPFHKGQAGKGQAGKAQHNSRPTETRSFEPQRQSGPRPSGLWLYGMHPARAALANPKRRVQRVVLTERAAEEIGGSLLGRARTEIASMEQISKLLPPNSVHQGIALQVQKLPRLDLDDVLAAGGERRRVVLVLDQVTDPHNTGAILRSAVAFGVDAVIVQNRNAPDESGVLAKAASGALDIVPYVQVVNIARTLEDLGKRDFWRIGLAGDGEMALSDAARAGDIALVLGSEGSGLRRLVRESCDTAAFIPMDGAMESLNVSNAAAIALYELRRT